MSEFDLFINQIIQQYAILESSLDPFAIQAIVTISAITIYAIFSGSFYETLSKKQIFKLHIPKPELFSDQEQHVRLWDIIVLILQYTIVFPLVTLIWTVALTIFLLALSSTSPAEVAVLSLSMVAATRIVAYYDEKIAEEVAKLLPLALLVLIVSGPASLSAQAIILKGSALISQIHEFIPLFVFLMATEWTLRLSLEIKYTLFGRPDEDETELDHLLSHYKKPKRQR